jgi:hypothetical protein
MAMAATVPRLPALPRIESGTMPPCLTIPTRLTAGTMRWSPLSVWCGAVHFSLE